MLQSIFGGGEIDTMLETDGWRNEVDAVASHLVRTCSFVPEGLSTERPYLNNGLFGSGICLAERWGTFHGPVQSHVTKWISKRKRFTAMALLSLSLQSAVAAPVEVDLTTFQSGAGVRFDGSLYSSTGFSVSAVGDHNGDGFQDFAYASSWLNRAVIVMKKNTTYTPLSIDATVSGQYFRVIDGPDSSNFGHTVGRIGDINADGFDDVIVNALFGEVAGRGPAGYAYVLFGMAGPFTDLTVTATWAASSLGFMILGTQFTTSFITSPHTALGLGDVNGDGIDDFAVSTKYFPELPADNTAAGVVYVIFGKNDSAFTTIDLVPTNFDNHGIYYIGADNMALGFCVGSAGDFNGDGIADFLLSAHDFDPIVGGVKRNNAGAAYLIYGSKIGLTTLHMSNFTTGSMGVRFLGGASDHRLGISLAGVGDINDDGINDIAIGAPYADAPIASNRPDCGIVYVIYGTTAAFTGDLDLKDFSSFSQGFVIFGHTPGASLVNAAPAGDINEDGVNDIVVAGSSFLGKVSVVYGQKMTRSSHVDIFTASVTSFSFALNSYLGFSLDGGRDLNGDGMPDLLLGAFRATITPEAGGSSLTDAGAVWMLPGPFVVPSDAPSADPSAMTSRIPSMIPSVEPSELPSAIPSLEPSMMPSVDPSVEPSLDPSAAPSLMPTMVPSTEPTFLPSQMPTVLPTIRPTDAADANFELTVSVEQEVLNLEKSDYDAQQAACNLTIQHTVADAVVGTTPERVTDIVVEEEEEDAGGRTSLRFSISIIQNAVGNPLRLMYTLTVRDPTYTVALLRAELVQAAQEGTMDARLRFYAAQFGASNLANVTFGSPRVTGAEPSSSDSDLADWEIALIVIGGVLVLVLIGSGLWWHKSKKSDSAVLPAA